MTSKQAFKFKLTTDRKTGHQLLTLEGDLGSGSAVALRSKLQAAGIKGDLTVRLQNIDYLDLPTIQILYALMKSLSSHGIRTVIDPALSSRHEILLQRTGFGELTKKI